MATLTCKPDHEGSPNLCVTHSEPWSVVDEHEFEGCIVGAAEYIAEMEIEMIHYRMHRCPGAHESAMGEAQ